MARSRTVRSCRGAGGVSIERYSVAMARLVDERLANHLRRKDGNEDLCLAVYMPSTGATRFTALITELIFPEGGDRVVSGRVEFCGDFVLRAASKAADIGGGVAILHSHPKGKGWQSLSTFDRDAELSFAVLAMEVTGLPLLGMTYACIDSAWSARFWLTYPYGAYDTPCESVRVIGDRLAISWNPALAPVPSVTTRLTRTVSCWGKATQADFARLRVVVVGVGTLGLDIALRFAAAGVQHIGLLDFDSVEICNLDRLLDASAWDVWLGRSKLEHAARALRRNATAQSFTAQCIDGSVCEPSNLAQVLDYDLIVCAIDDHPWPRSIINSIAYTDLIPVIDGGVHIDTFPESGGLRNATWRAHVLRPGRPCMVCNAQLDLGSVQADKQGLWEDETYVAGIPAADRSQGQNVGMFAAGASAGMLAQTVSFMVQPSGFGEPGPIRFSLSTHWLEHIEVASQENCVVESQGPIGDRRRVLSGEDKRARIEITRRQERASRIIVRAMRMLERWSEYLMAKIKVTLTERQNSIY